MKKHLLLYRNKRHQYERIEDYFDRISIRNGFSTSDYFTKYLKDVIPDPDYWSKAFGENYTTFPKVVYMRLSEALEVSIVTQDIDRENWVFNSNNRKVCPKCYKKDPIVLFYWYFQGYSYCHICKAPMINYNFLDGKKAPVKRMEKSWFYVVLERGLGSSEPLTYILNEISLNNESLFLCKYLRLFLEEYGFSLNVFDESLVVEDERFIIMDPNSKYDTLIDLLIIGAEIDSYSVRFIAALVLISGKGDFSVINRFGDNEFSGRFCLLSESWAVEVLSAYDWSRYFKRYKNSYGYNIFLNLDDFIDGFDWLTQKDSQLFHSVIFYNRYELKLAWLSESSMNKDFHRGEIADNSGSLELIKTESLQLRRGLAHKCSNILHILVE